MSDFWNIEQLNSENNLGSGHSFVFIDPADIVVDPFVIDNNISTAHVLESGKTWWSADFTENTLSFAEKPGIKAGSHITTPTLTGYIPKDDLQKLNLMFKMAKHGLVVLYTNNNGDVRQIGSKENPAKLQRTTNHGSASATNKISFSISVINGQEGAPFYQSALPPTFTCGSNTPTIQGFFALGYNDLGDITIGADGAGYYDSLITDGASDPIVFKINTVETALPFTLSPGDVLAVNRVVSDAAGWYKIYKSV